MKVKVVILNYNGMEHLKDCIRSVESINYDNFEIIVIDNNSSDDSVRYINENHVDTTVFKIEKHLMFAGGYNYFFNQEQEDCFYMILNNDTIVDEDILKDFMVGIKKYGANNIYGCKIMYANSTDKIWYAGGEVDLSKGLIRHIGIREKEGEEVDCETDYITGCCMFVHSSIIKKLNGFDERFSMYMEDVDFCLRAQKKGIFFFSVFFHS